MAVKKMRAENITEITIEQSTKDNVRNVSGGVKQVARRIIEKVVDVAHSQSAKRDMARYAEKGRRFSKRAFAMLLCAVMVITSLTLYPSQEAKADGTAVSNAYILEIATGTSAGTQIEFIEIKYTGTDNKPHKQFLFPNEDSLANGYKDVRNYGTDESIAAGIGNDLKFWQSASYPHREIGQGSGLKANSIDQYYFTTPVGIKSVQKIDAFMGNKGTWTCLRLQLFRVDKLGGYRMAGQISNTWFMDFEGELIAEITGGNNNWNRSDANYLRMNQKATLKTNFNGVSYAHHEMQSKHNYGFRMDIADVYGAGFESLVLNYDDGTPELRSTSSVAETMALTITYQDIYGQYRFVRLPVIMNLVQWAWSGNIEKSSNKKVWGIGQQGESIGFVADLPDCKEITKVEAIFGGKEAMTETGFFYNQNVSVMQRRTNESEKDDIRMTRFMVYDMNNASMSVKIDGAQLSYTFSGNPILYRVSGDATGDVFYATSRRDLLLKRYDGKSIEVPPANKEYYLVQLTTDDVSAAATKSDLYMTLNYVNSKGKDMSTSEVSLTKACSDYYGFWPGNTDNFAYKWGVNSGHTISALITLSDVDYFTGLKLKMKSPTDGSKVDDDYQFKNLRIYSVTKLGDRKVVWNQKDLNGLGTRVDITRNVEGQTSTIKILDVAKTVLVQEDRDIKVDFESLKVDNIVENTWSMSDYRISYEQAMQDFNFTKVRKIYTVTVNVFDDTVATDDQGRVVSTGGNGDAGSENLFYFQLIFRDGTSCYELANTQLEGDRFASGASESFQIETNQDYGEVTAIRIIPDDISEDSKKYDKLRIDNIKVTESDVTGTHDCWVANDVGWIGVGYTEEQEQNGAGGRKGRTAGEMAKTKAIDYTTNVIQLEVALHTNNYSQGAGYASQFIGSLRGQFTVVLNNGQRTTLDSFDIVEKMYQYANKRSGAKGNAVSDSSKMFRVNHTDRFLVDIDDVKELVSLDLTAQTKDKPYDWAIGGVAISLITDGGILRLNANDEYQIDRDETPEILCTHRSEESPAYLLKVKSSNPETVNIPLTDNEIDVGGDYGKIVSKITRVPASQGDELNLFVFTTPGSESINNYDLDATVNYAHVYGPIYQTGRRMKAYAGKEGERDMFYLAGLPASGMIDLNKILFKAEPKDGKLKMCKLDYAIIQQVRAGVVVANYYVNLCNENSYYGVAKFATTNPEEIGYKDAQIVTLQFGSTTESRMLFADRLDMAVALRYKLANDPNGDQYQTPYVFLTDQDILSIQAGQVVDLKFNQMFVGEVTGLRLATIGDIEATIDAAYVTTARADTTGKPTDSGHYSFADGVVVSQTGVTVYQTSSGADDLESIRSVTFGFKTAEAGKTEGSGTDGPVAMKLYTADKNGVVNAPVDIDDIRKYMVERSENFEMGQLQYVRFLVKGASTIRRIEIEPKSADLTGNAGWTLEYATAKLDFGREDTRAVGERIYEGTPKRITFANVTAKAKVYNPSGANDTYKEQLVQDNTVKLVVPAEKGFIITPIIQGSELGNTVTVVEVRDGEYVSNELSSLLKYENSTGNYIFTAPKEEKTKYYRITVASVEVPEVNVQINLTVAGTEETEPKKTETGEGSGTGTGEGSGTGTGEGSGTGSSEGSGTGSSEGSGTGSGEGSGTGSGEGSGTGSSEGSGTGSGEGSGTGTGENAGAPEGGAASENAGASENGAVSENAGAGEAAPSAPDDLEGDMG